MQNDMRDRLIGLISSAGYDYDDFIEESHEKGLSVTEDFEEWCADHLIANGVIVPPCKVGDKVWCIYWETIYESIATKVTVITGIENSQLIKIEAEFDMVSPFYSDGRTMKYAIYDNYLDKVFLTKDQAKQKLKELSENG